MFKLRVTNYWHISCRTIGFKSNQPMQTFAIILISNLISIWRCPLPPFMLSFMNKTSLSCDVIPPQSMHVWKYRTHTIYAPHHSKTAEFTDNDRMIIDLTLVQPNMQMLRVLWLPFLQLLTSKCEAKNSFNPRNGVYPIGYSMFCLVFLHRQVFFFI